ncbi:MAG TPA: MFS transporter, partial [Actinomycetota bacterium]
VGLLPMAAAGSIPAMAALTVIGGLSLAPVTVCEFLLVRECAPPGTVTEAYAWILTATFGGSALGNALGGVVVSAAGWRAGVLAAAACLGTGAAIVAARQGSLGSSVDHTRGAD